MGTHKADFERDLKDFVATLREGVSTPEGEWTIKGFIDVFKNDSFIFLIQRVKQKRVYNELNFTGGIFQSSPLYP